MRSIKRIIKIYKIDGYRVHCLFSNGESRIIDFEKVFKDWNIKQSDIEFPLVKSIIEFQKIQLEEGTFIWKNIEIKSLDENGEEEIYFYDLDPIVMYEMSEADESRKTDIGLMIKQTRKELGLTQEQLALKSGTTKHYISRIENNKSGIELSTLIKIIEGGLGKRLQISIS